MASLLHAEHRRAAIMGASGLAAVGVLLVFRLLAGGGDEDVTAPLDSALLTTPAPPAGAPPATAPPSPASPPVDPAQLRDPFCPLVSAPAAPGSAPVVCRRSPPPPGRQAVGLQDVFVEAGTRLARMHVGSVTFPNLHEGETFAGSFRVVSLADRCGVFEHEGKSFPLCEGEDVFR